MLGAAILAATGAGLFPSLDAGVERMVQTMETYTPDPKTSAAYQERLKAFSDIYERLH